MKQTELDAVGRTDAGKGVARKLRAAGRIPGVLYGRRTKTVSLSVDARTFNRIVSFSRGEQILFSLNLKEIEGGEANRLALMKDIQRHPVSGSIRHVDFYEVFMDQEVTTGVPLVISGKAKGVELEGGVLDLIQRTIQVACLPTAIPDEIRVDVTNLGAGEALHASDIVLPEGVRLVEDPKAAIVTITRIVEKETAAPEGGETSE